MRNGIKKITAFVLLSTVLYTATGVRAAASVQPNVPTSVLWVMDTIRHDEHYKVKDIYYNAALREVSIAITNHDNIITDNRAYPDYYVEHYNILRTDSLEELVLYAWKKGKTFKHGDYDKAIGSVALSWPVPDPPAYTQPSTSEVYSHTLATVILILLGFLVLLYIIVQVSKANRANIPLPVTGNEQTPSYKAVEQDTPPPPPVTTPTEKELSVADEIKKLSDLYDLGEITAQQYQHQKDKLLE